MPPEVEWFANITNAHTRRAYENAAQRNPDGSVTLYVGQQAPKGLESNWIPTAGKRPLPCMRLYGPTDAVNDRTFKLSDFELMT